MFFQHNIEDDPLNVNFARSFHAAIFESCLHHFVDPISALYHVSMALRDDGVILILEGENRNGPIGEPYLSAMLATNTLERPLPRSLLEECLNLAGLPHYEFVGAINGYFSPREPRPSDMNLILETSCSNANLVVCAKTDVALRRVFPALGDRSSADEPGNSDGTTAKGKRDADPLSAVLSRLPQWLTGR
jgi:SAM-dependent methyltransferase